jgi:hypothetical protein
MPASAADPWRSSSLRCLLAATIEIVWRRITSSEYDKKARELKDRQTEIGMRIEQHQQGDAGFRTTLES